MRDPSNEHDKADDKGKRSENQMHSVVSRPGVVTDFLLRDITARFPQLDESVSSAIVPKKLHRLRRMEMAGAWVSTVC